MFRSLVRPSLPSLVCGRTAPIVGASASIHPASAIYLQSMRGAVVDRAAKVVSLKRRTRRHLLRKIALAEKRPINEAQRMADREPPLASYQVSAANLHQFIVFLARQSSQRNKKEQDAQKSSSTQIVRDVAKPAWELQFSHIKTIIEQPENRTFRACEELLGALSDPTTELGQGGLNPADLAFVLSYVKQTMEKCIRLLEPKLKEVDGEFNRLDVEDQYQYAGSFAIQFLLAKIEKNSAAEQEVLLRARAGQVLPPTKTMLAEAMQFDVYPERTPEALLASTRPKQQETVAAKSL